MWQAVKGNAEESSHGLDAYEADLVDGGRVGVTVRLAGLAKRWMRSARVLVRQRCYGHRD
jgi:hypothetical protein